ncbi:MAG: hypothetical protein ACOYMY_13145, partial [Prochlorococcaceae cyanobacterium]
MPRRPAISSRSLAPSAPRRRPEANGAGLRERLATVRGEGVEESRSTAFSTRPQPAKVPLVRTGFRGWMTAGLHPLSDGRTNARLQAYDSRVKEAFDRIVPVLKQLSALQHEDDFVARAQLLARAELGYEL